MITKLLLLYFVFFKIGLFSFGGGYAILSLMQVEIIENNQWLTYNEFVNMVVISQITPGPISVNAATYVGYKVTESFLGAVITTLGLATPSIIIMCIFTRFFLKFKNNEYILNFFSGIKIVVLGLILSVGLSLINKNNFIDIKSYLIFLINILILLKWKINPIILIIISGIIGIILY